MEKISVNTPVAKLNNKFFSNPSLNFKSQTNILTNKITGMSFLSMN